MTRPPVVIAGGGIAGLSAALAIARAGCPVEVFEREDVSTEEGAGLQLSPNASRHLRTWGVLEQLERTALAPREVVVRRARDAAVLAKLDLRGAEARWGAPFRIVHRADLHAALRSVAAAQPRIKVTAGTGVTGWTEGGHLAVQTAAGDATAAALIVADGVRSTLRNKFAPGATLVSAGLTAWRALVPAKRCVAFAKEPASNLWLGPDAHLVHYPLRGGSTVNLVVIVGERGVPADGDLWSRPGDPKMIQSRLVHWSRDARDLVALAEEWRVWPLFSLRKPPHPASGPIALVGDAAHPMMPFLAQGAAQAIEDAAALGAAFATHADVPDALALYAKSRARRVANVVAASERQARIYHLQGPAASLRDRAIHILGGAGLRLATDWIYRAQDQNGADGGDRTRMG